MPLTGQSSLLDLNDLRVFERVASLGGFSVAARALSLPRSNVSRSIARLEAMLGTRLIHRTTRQVELTAAGESLRARCKAALDDLDKAADHVGHHAAEVQGELRISAGVGFGINVLAEQFPDFLLRYPKVAISLDLSSRPAELVSSHVDVAIRFGPLSDSSMVATRLGEMRRVLCASPDYLERSGTPSTVDDLVDHETIEIPGPDGRARVWRFMQGAETREVAIQPRVSVNEALTIHRLIVKGAGIGIVSCYVCAPDIRTGRLVHLLPQWTVPNLEVNMLFPSRRELAPAVRAFVDFMKETNQPGFHWQDNELPGMA